MQVTGDRSRCIGAGHCVRHAPDVFDSDNDGRVVVTRPEASNNQLELLRDIEGMCPSSAIRISLAEHNSNLRLSPVKGDEGKGTLSA